MIDSKRSRFRKNTVNYNQDQIFNIIDVEAELNKDKVIEKCELASFLYAANLNQDNQYKNTNNRDLIPLINNNKLGIKIDELKFYFKNGYSALFIEKFIPLEYFGEGAFGLVIKAYDALNKINVAIKIIPKNRFSRDTYMFLEREIAILKQLDHPNVLKLKSFIDNEEVMFLIMDYLEGGSLKDLILKRYQEENAFMLKDHETSLIIKGILEGLEYLHSNNIMHRDIKPGK